MTVTKQDVVDAVAKETGLMPKEVKVVLEAVMSKIVESVDKRNAVVFRGFGRFDAVMRKPKVGHDFVTKKSITLPGRWVVKFSPADDFTNLLNGITKDTEE